MAYLREAFLGVAARANVESREQVLDRARAGDLLAFEAITDVTTLPADAVDALTERLCSVVDTLIKNAAGGLSDFGGLDPAHALTLLGVWHPSEARWDRIENLMTVPEIGPQQLAGCLRVLAVHGQSLDLAARTRLAGYVAALRHRKLGPNFFGEDEDISSLAAEALATLTDRQERKALVRELLARDAAHRAASARIIERFGDDAEIQLLLALVGDASEDVRDAALGGLNRFVAAEHSPDEAPHILAKIIESGGRQSARAIVSRLRTAPEVPAVSQLLALATQHPSAQVRAAARGGHDE